MNSLKYFVFEGIRRFCILYVQGHCNTDTFNSVFPSPGCFLGYPCCPIPELLPCCLCTQSCRKDCAIFNRLWRIATKESEHYVMNNYYTGSKKLNSFIERIALLNVYVNIYYCGNCFISQILLLYRKFLQQYSWTHLHWKDCPYNHLAS